MCRKNVYLSGYMPLQLYDHTLLTQLCIGEDGSCLLKQEVLVVVSCGIMTQQQRLYTCVTSYLGCLGCCAVEVLFRFVYLS